MVYYWIRKNTIKVNLVFLILLCACREIREDKNYILATTGMLYDITKNICPDFIKVDYLMGQGVDPHLYKFSQIDLQKLNKSTLIVCNGLHLEGKMNYVLEKISKKKKVVSVGDSLNLNSLIPISPKLYDPHIWFDINLWKECTKVVSNNLQNTYPLHKNEIQKKTQEYILELEKLQVYTKKRLEEIPEKQRVLITSHDAFRYFEKAYNFKVKALQGVSTTADYGLKDVKELVDFVNENNIKAIFVETSLPTKGMEAVLKGVEAKGKTIQLIEGLYSDAMGAFGTPEGTYIGMYKSNIDKIVEALK
ncbi:MAG: metal ABC transporter solute-binding protein, Zn/Mn family [Raineya sp.]